MILRFLARLSSSLRRLGRVAPGSPSPRCVRVRLLAGALAVASLPAQTVYFGFDATVSSPTPTRVNYSIRVGNLVGQAIDPYLRAFGGPLELYVYHVPDLAGNDLSRLRAGHFLRQSLRSATGSFDIPAYDGLTYCYFSLEALPVLWGVAGVYEAGARLPVIGANAPSRIGVVGGAYTSVQNAEQIHNLINSAIVPLSRATALELMNGQKTLLLRDPVTGDSRYAQWQPWTHWLFEDNGRRVLKEVVVYFQNKKHGAYQPYYEQLELHAVPVARCRHRASSSIRRCSAPSPRVWRRGRRAARGATCSSATWPTPTRSWSTVRW